MWLFILFVVPHVILVFADGWDTLRSMIVRLVSESNAAGGQRRMNNKARGFFGERPLPTSRGGSLRCCDHRTRRDLLLFGAGAVAALAGGGWLLPQATLGRFGVHRYLDSPLKEWFLNKALRIDDDVAEALYSPIVACPPTPNRRLLRSRTTTTERLPIPAISLDGHLTLDGLASGVSVALDIRSLMSRFSIHEQITRLVCVEGWSAIAWWAGLRFDDLLRAYPPASQAKWVRVESSVNLDASGNPDPYFMSLDLATARHPQTLLATHFNGQPLTVEHGAPLRLLVPVKLGLKNVKAITSITYVAEEPRDYWAERGYSRYDGI